MTEQGSADPTVEPEPSVEPEPTGEPIPEPQPEPGITKDEGMAYAATFAFLAIVITALAVFLLIVVLRNRKMKSNPMTSFLISILGSTAAIGCLVAPAYAMGYYGYELPVVLCKMCHYFSGLAVSAKILTQAAVAVVRYKSHFSGHPCRWKTAIWILSLKWGLSVAYAVVWPLTFSMVEANGRNGCNRIMAEPWINVSRVFSAVDFFVTYVIPSLVIALSYLSICLHGCSKSMKGLIIMYSVLAVAFAVCQFPRRYVELVLMYSSEKVSVHIRSVVVIVSLSNAVINSLTLMAFSTDVKQALKELCRDDQVRSFDD